MKRSEMIQIIKDKLFECFIIDATTEERAGWMLKEIEKAGMLPPPDKIDWGVTDDILYARYNHDPMEDYENQDLSLLWEPEND